MNTTNARAIRTAIRSAIEGITPTYAEHQDARWVYAESPTDVPGPAIRTFTLLADVAIADDPDDAVMGGGISYSYTLQVMASYGDLPLVEDESIIEEDARDIWLAIDLAKATTDGLIEATYPDWDTDSADGHVFGVFEMTVRYFGRNS